MKIKDLPICVLDVICTYTGTYPLEIFVFEGSRYYHDSAAVTLDNFRVCTRDKNRARDIAKNAEWYRLDYDFCSWHKVTRYTIDENCNVSEKVLELEQL